MRLGSLLALLVIVFAAVALLGRIAIDPWWGILALAVAVVLGGFAFPAFTRR